MQRIVCLSLCFLPQLLEVYMQILRSQVENNLNASFVALGLIASVPDVDDTIWKNFTRRTLFLRPNVKTLVYCQRLLGSQRAEFERAHNRSIMTVLANSSWARREQADEYAPVVFETDDVDLYMYDAGSSPILNQALVKARK